jgi:hypothetical protein
MDGPFLLIHKLFPDLVASLRKFETSSVLDGLSQKRSKNRPYTTNDLNYSNMKDIRSVIIHHEVSKIFRIEAVKLLELTIRPIGRHQPRRSSLPHVDTGPTFFSNLERFMEVIFCQSVKHSLRFGQDLLNGIKPASFQLQFCFRNRKKSQGVKSGEHGGWGMTILSFARNCWERKEL